MKSNLAVRLITSPGHRRQLRGTISFGVSRDESLPSPSAVSGHLLSFHGSRDHWETRLYLPVQRGGPYVNYRQPADAVILLGWGSPALAEPAAKRTLSRDRSSQGQGSDLPPINTAAERLR